MWHTYWVIFLLVVGDDNFTDVGRYCKFSSLTWLKRMNEYIVLCAPVCICWCTRKACTVEVTQRFATVVAFGSDMKQREADQRAAESHSASPAGFLSLLPEWICRCFLPVVVASELLRQDKTLLFSSYTCFVFVRVCMYVCVWTFEISPWWCHSLPAPVFGNK